MEFRIGDELPIQLENEIVDIKKGGFGIVYIFRELKSKKLHALKTFQSKYFQDRKVLEDFYREAETWVKLRKHKNIVEATGVMQIKGKPHIWIEYVDGGTLRRKLGGDRLDIAESLNYGIQFCNGMANAKYIELNGNEKTIVHRDIKPENLMLTKEGILKITDFGLVKALGAPSTDKITGTPEYMSPEQFVTMDVDTRSDIYSFGIVLYEMLAGELPFRVWAEDISEKWMLFMRHHHETIPKPPIQINSEIPASLEKIVLRCLAKNPSDRYEDFTQLREELMSVYKSYAKKMPEIFEETESKSTAGWMYEVGASLKRLGKREEAMQYFERAVELDPTFAFAWAGKGAILDDMGLLEDAIRCYDRALEIDPRLSHVWNNKGISLGRLNRLDEALRCYEKALEIDKDFCSAWVNKGLVLKDLGRTEEALFCYDKALEADPAFELALFWKGTLLFELDRFEEAMIYFNKILEKDPNHKEILKMKGASLLSLERVEEALLCFDRVIQLESPFEDANLWFVKGVCLERLGRFEEAIECCNKALEYKPQYTEAWMLEGNCLRGLGRFEEAILCYKRAQEN